MTLSLFSGSQGSLKPLAERMRPSSLEDVFGHDEILSESSLLQKELSQNRLFSFILWGPPGIGKTTYARLITKQLDAHFINISAVSAGVKTVREVIDKATINRDKFNSLTVLFIDEIHRFNKSQQDALLHAVESGLIILIGATTENPSFEVNSALLSRMHVFKLHALKSDDIKKIIKRAIESDELFKEKDIELSGIEEIINLSAGDGRRALSLLENAYFLAYKEDEPKLNIKSEHVITAAKNHKTAYDKKDEYHYDTVSAFIKSIRGSDPDAAVLWLARMLDGGEDPMFIARRLVISASEDIGNSDPTALILANNAMQAVHKIGMPEARIILAQVVTYLASTHKSNASYMAINTAMADIQNNPKISVPLHLRNAVTTLMKNENYGKGYLYSHDYPNNFAEQNYFPDEIKEKQYYMPNDLGREGKLKERLTALWKKRFQK